MCITPLSSQNVFERILYICILWRYRSLRTIAAHAKIQLRSQFRVGCSRVRGMLWKGQIGIKSCSFRWDMSQPGTRRYTDTSRPKQEKLSIKKQNLSHNSMIIDNPTSFKGFLSPKIEFPVQFWYTDVFLRSGLLSVPERSEGTEVSKIRIRSCRVPA